MRKTLAWIVFLLCFYVLLIACCGGDIILATSILILFAAIAGLTWAIIEIF